MFHSYLDQTPIRNTIVTKLKTLFETMRSANRIVKTSTYVAQMGFSNYIFKRQHDAQEALAEILNNCYQDISQSVFCIKFQESIVCDRDLQGCGEKSERCEYDQILKLEIQETNELQSVENILIRSFGNEMPKGYKCNLGPNGGCGKENTCSKTSHVTELKDILIVQLLIFTYDVHGNDEKRHPTKFPFLFRYLLFTYF